MRAGSNSMGRRSLEGGALALGLLAAFPVLAETRLEGALTQGGLVRGQTAPGSLVTLDGKVVRVAANGHFAFGFGREAGPTATLAIVEPGGATDIRTLAIAPRPFDIQRITGLPERMVTPKPEDLERIRRDNLMVSAARKNDFPETWFAEAFDWPARGRITGVYGSQRILNGEPRQPHYGIDIAAPAGTPILAPMPGRVTLADTDQYFTGGTVILDHGHGISSTFLHLQTVTVKLGDVVPRGGAIGTLGATGRATGPHLDWRINWFDVRLDPALVVPPMPAE